jgi:hypothetical protein
MPVVSHLSRLAAASRVLAPSSTPKENSFSGVCQPDRSVARLCCAAAVRCFFLPLDRLDEFSILSHGLFVLGRVDIRNGWRPSWGSGSAGLHRPGTVFALAVSRPAFSQTRTATYGAPAPLMRGRCSGHSGEDRVRGGALSGLGFSVLCRVLPFVQGSKGFLIPLTRCQKTRFGCG